MLREWEFHMAQAANLGFIPGECHIAALQSGTPYGFWRDDRRVPASRLHTTVVDAYSAAGVKNGNNNTIFLTPDSHSQTAALAFNKNMTHLVGMYPEAFQNQRSRLTQAAVLASFVAVSGYGNLFKNLYFQYGEVTSSSNLNCLTDTGGRNSYINCHFLIGDAAMLDSANFDLIRLGSNEIYFKNCFFGGDTVAMTNGNLVEFQASADPPRSVFENCIFLMYADAADPFFLKTVAGLGRCLIIFKGCQFINVGTTLNYGIDGTGLGNAKMVFDQNCSFHGVTAPIAAAHEADILVGAATYVASTVTNLLGGTADEA